MIIRSLLTSAALVASVPAFAQTTGAEPVEPMPSTTVPSKPATPAKPATGATSAVPASTTATPAASTTAATPAAATGATVTQATDATVGTTTASGAAATGTAAVSNPTSAVSAVIDSQFATYDGDKSGDLSQAEFAKWLTALKTAELKASGKTMTAAEIGQWSSGAFVTADTDKNSIVTKAELTTFLSGGSAG